MHLLCALEDQITLPIVEPCFYLAGIPTVIWDYRTATVLEKPKWIGKDYSSNVESAKAL